VTDVDDLVAIPDYHDIKYLFFYGSEAVWVNCYRNWEEDISNGRSP